MNARPKPQRAVPPGRGPEGAHPVKQARSRELRDRALACAHELVECGCFATTSMADIARKVGCSVGALYFRFHDKEGLFASVVEVTMARELEQLAARAAEGRYRGLSLRETVAVSVRDFVSFVQRNEHMIRALYQRTIEESAYWNIVRETALEMTSIWIDAVAQAAGHAGERGFIRQAGVAFQFASSALVYTVLIDRPVRPLGTRELEFWLDEMVMHFIQVHVPESLRRPPAARPTGTEAPAATRTASRTPGKASAASRTRSRPGAS